MQKILNNLRLSTKLNLTVAISTLAIILISIMFYIITSIFVEIIHTNNASQLKIRLTTKDIDTGLRAIEHLTITNSLQKTPEYINKSGTIYEDILLNIQKLESSSFFNNNKESKIILTKLKNRIQGYKLISDSLREDVQEDSEDGLYSILALSSTSQKISLELEALNTIIAQIAQKNIQETDQHISFIKSISLAITFVVFLFILYINKTILLSTLQRIHNLQDKIVSFFDLLSHKRVDTISTEEDNGKDEIAEIARVIDKHMYIAEKILMQEREETSRVEARVQAATKEILELNDEVEATQREVVFTMGAIAEERSKETANHVKRVAEYSLILARFYGLSLEESLLLKNASPMHDIGKIGIPDAILNKPGRFTDEEFNVMKSHSEIGYRMLKHSKRSILKAAAILAYQHHERWDGKGYPQGLKGNEIHIYGRITAVTDVFDALDSDRVYKKAWPLTKIISFFEEQRGKQFDPELIDIFLDNLEHFLAAKEMIENEEEGILLSSFIENFEKVDEYI
jgi:HD-GYP domain-containing protein (c-di-GMP phosphodiesterase class II)